VTFSPEGGWPHCQDIAAEQHSGTSRALKPNLSQTDGNDEVHVKDLLRPPMIHLEVRRLEPHQPSKAVFEDIFEEHHYMRGKLPSCFFGVIVREKESGMPVAFHAISNFPGKGNGGITFLESRLVTLPQWQGFAIGPRLSEGMGQILLSAGKRLFSVTHHPRLGQQREKSNLWKATSCNGKAAQSLNGTKTGRKAFRHQFMGSDGHGNDQLAKDASANSVGLLSRPGVLMRGLLDSCMAHTREQIMKMEGKTPEEVLTSVDKETQGRTRKLIERCLSKGYMVLQDNSRSGPKAARSRLNGKALSSETPCTASDLHTPKKRCSLSTDESAVKRAKADEAAI